MNPRTHLNITGYVDAVPVPATGWGTAAFDLIHSPADADQLAPDAPDTVYACTTADPRIADALLREIQPGDLLRVTGTLAPPDSPAAPARLTVTALEVMDTALLPVLHDMVLERYGEYVVVFDADSDQVPVFTTAGRWVGEAVTPDLIGDLIAAHEAGGGPR